MYPEVETFIKISGDAAAAEQAAFDAASVTFRSANCGDGDCALYDVRDEAYRAASRARRITTNEAWQAMGVTSDEPLVKWIVDNCKDYQSYAIAILEALPADMERLNEIAVDGGWCSVWDRFVAQATEAGVVPGSTPMSEARQELRRWFRNHHSSCTDDVNRLIELVNAVVAAESQAETTINT